MNRWKFFAFILCCSVISVCGKYLYDYFLESHSNKQVYEAIIDIGFPDIDSENDEEEYGTEFGTESGTEKVQEVDNFDYASLLAMNNDCVGWICIPDTEIDYPIVQAADNSFYLYHNFNQAPANCGAIFMDYRNNIDLSQENLILYGHQMKDNSMFKQLNGYKKKEFYEEHPEIVLYLRDEKYIYDVVAVYVTNVEKSGGYYNYLHANTRLEQMEYLKKMAAYQLYDTGLTVLESDELLSLSTCEYSSPNGRLIVLAKRRDCDDGYKRN